VGPLFKTPTTQLAVNGGSQHPDKRRAGGHGPTLADEIEFLLPTPTTEPMTGNGHARNLGAEVQLLPTPRATDGKNGGPNQRGSSGDLALPSAVMKLLPTTTVMDYHASGGNSPSDMTLTDAVVRTQLGAITNPRLDAGSTSSIEQPQRPPSPTGTESRDSPPGSKNG
jgi:DNA (cytosine-5)-methyltransferase 1